ncbi:MAG: MATE family efflux transporter [Oscillospiraceae bacterium]
MKNNLLYKVFDAKSHLKPDEIRGEIPDNRLILKRTLKMAWPSVLESALLAVVGFVDTMMVSVLGDYAIAAVGLTQQPKMLCLAPFLALAPAVSALVARRKGENNRESAVRVLKLALIITAVIVAVVSTLAIVFAGDIMHFVGSQPDTHKSAVAYFSILAGGFVFNALTLVINAAQTGSGNTKISMKTSIASNLVNIVFNYILINGHLGFPKLGVAGAAIATVIGAAVGLGMAIASILHCDNFVYIRLKTHGIYDKQSVRSLAVIGSSALLEQVFLRTGFLINAKIIASLGTVAFSTHQIAQNILTISFSFGDGLSVAAVALVGYSLGEKRPDLAKVYGSFCQRCGFVCSSVLSLTYLIFGKYIFSWFTKTPEVIHDGTIIMQLMTVIVFFQISQVIYSGCLRGSGDAKYTALVSFINVGLLRPGIAALMIYVLHFGLIGAWAGLILDQFIRLIMTSIRFKKGKWMKIKI